MMGTRGKCDEEEYDAFSRSWRRHLCWGRGTLHTIKHRFWRSQRAAQHREERELVKRGGGGGGGEE